jgi:transposase InsO family protein
VTRYKVIAAEKAATGGTVTRACALLGVSRSAYYEWLREKRTARQLEDEAVGKRIKEIFEESKGTYGSPRIYHQLRSEKVRCSRKRVARLMTELGLYARQKRAYRTTTVADPTATLPMEDRLKRAFQPRLLALNAVWVGDITYIKTREGWAYLATVIDLASRRIVGWALSRHMRTSLVIEAFRIAVRVRRPKPGLIFHTDRGSQYTSSAFQELMRRFGVLQSFSRPAQCWDNAVAESFFAVIKRELIDRFTWDRQAALRRAVFAFIEGWYNTRRIHSALGYTSPANYERLKRAALFAAPAA